MAENKWITKKQMAAKKNVSVQAVNNWIVRELIVTKIEPKYGILLVDSTSLKVNPTSGRPKKVGEKNK